MQSSTNSGATPSESQLTNDFLKVAKSGSALGFGFMGASIQALGYQGNGFVFHFSFWTAVAFFAGVAISLLFWRMVQQKTQVKKASILLSAVGLFAFFYPAKFIPAQNRYETIFGLLLALAVLSVLGFVFWKLKCWLDRDFDSANRS